MKKENLKGKTKEDLEQVVNNYGEQKFRAKQIMKWIYKGETEFENMTDVPAPFRDQLANVAYISQLDKVASETASDGTQKFLFGLNDGHKIETVLIPSTKRNTVCISTQVGCQVSCTFCATGQMDFQRNLSAAEIVDQVLQVKLESDKKISNIVIMGMGEPLFNLKNLLKSLNIFNADLGFDIGARKTTISTIGIPDKIIELAEHGLKNRLAISFHSADDEIRQELMPFTRKYSVTDLIEPIKKYADVSSRWVTLEYIMFTNVNSSLEDASKLIEFAKDLPVKVNIIPFNQVSGVPYQPASDKQIKKFQAYLLQNQITTTIRDSRGDDISAACGQLATKSEK